MRRDAVTVACALGASPRWRWRPAADRARRGTERRRHGAAPASTPRDKVFNPSTQRAAPCGWPTPATGTRSTRPTPTTGTRGTSPALRPRRWRCSSRARQGQHELVPDLAENPRHASDDAKTWTYTLRRASSSRTAPRSRPRTSSTPSSGPWTRTPSRTARPTSTTSSTCRATRARTRTPTRTSSV